jgi:hypothetical protein
MSPDLFNIRQLLVTTLTGLIIGLLVGSVSSWYLTASYKNAKCDALVAGTAAQTSKALAIATERVIRLEREAVIVKDAIERKDHEQRAQVEQTLADNRKLARQLGGLRDPGFKSNSCALPAGTNTPGSATDSTSRGQLSDEATEFLLEFAADADRVASYAKTCHEWVNQTLSPEVLQELY